MRWEDVAEAIHCRLAYHDAIECVTVTKLDGTARGGVLFAIAHKLKRPIRFIGVGEQAEDLRDFSARDFVDALLDDG